MKLWRLLIAVALLLGFGAATCGAQSSSRGVYTVKQGDTLGGILYGLRAQGIDTTNIMRLNPALGMERIYPGETILYEIPGKPLPSVSQEEMQREVNKEAQEILNAQNEALAKLSAGQKNIATQENSHFGIIITGLGAVIVLLGVVAWRVSRGQHANEVVRENIRPKRETTAALQEPTLLRNPDIASVEDLAQRVGKKSIDIILSLDEEHEIRCTVELQDDGTQPKVYFDANRKPVGWKHRKQEAATILGIRNANPDSASSTLN